MFDTFSYFLSCILFSFFSFFFLSPFKLRCFFISFLSFNSLYFLYCYIFLNSHLYFFSFFLLLTMSLQYRNTVGSPLSVTLSFHIECEFVHECNQPPPPFKIAGNATKDCTLCLQICIRYIRSHLYNYEDRKQNPVHSFLREVTKTFKIDPFSKISSASKIFCQRFLVWNKCRLQ